VSALPPSEPLLSQPIEVGTRRLRNRIISSPMERNLATTSGLITPAYVRYLEARAAGGAAVVFTESSYIRADGRARRYQMGIHNASVVAPLRELAERIHRHGALLGVELNHGGRTAQTAVNGVRCVAPSAVPCAVAGGEVPEPLTGDDIRDLIRCYAEAAVRCLDAGVDVLMLHGAHGYLIHQFMSPRTNLRDDEWAAPAKFLTEVIDAVRDAVPTATLGIRFSALEGPPDGLGVDETLEIVARAPLDRLDFLDISAGSYESGEWIVQPGEWEEGVLGRFAQRYRQFGLPVSVVGRITEPETAEGLLQRGEADLVSVGRALHADPRWADAATGGRRFRPCITTNHCIDSLFTGQPVPCSVNPDVGGAAGEPGADLVERLIVVAGAGPGGLEAARACAARGARVVLFEREKAIGGLIRLSAGLRTYPRYQRIVDWYDAELRGLSVDLRLEEEASPSTIAALRPHAVLIATGGRGIMPDIAGIQSSRVHEIRTWLRAGAPDLGDEQYVVWGADREGVAVADDLLARGKRILVIGDQKTLAPDVGRRAKILTVPRLSSDPLVQIQLQSRLVAVTDDGLTIRRHGHVTSLRAPGPVLVSQGVTPVTDLATALTDAGYDGAVRLVGDASGAAGGISSAIATAVRTVSGLRPAMWQRMAP
jgi:2,4-dienoyl-CoA reductase-like NADH-dependent reductase (Old Yellow Enzyme family)/thioredoxin reductase